MYEGNLHLNGPNIAVAGVGGRGTGFLKTLARTDDAGTAVAFADPHAPSRQCAGRWAPDATIHDDWRQMLSSTPCDVLMITAPQYVHADMVVAALDRGIDVYCEKPMAHTLDDCDRIIAAVNASDALFYVGLQLRTVPVFKHVKQLIDDGAVGKPRTMFYRELRGPFVPKVDNWIADESKSGGALVEKNVHHFDLFNWYCGGRAVRVHAIGGKALTAEQGGNVGQLLDHAFVLVDYDNDMRACLQMCFFCPAWAHELEIIGDNGRRLVTDLEDLKLYDAESDTRRHDAWHFGIERAHGDPSGWLDFLERRERGSTREDSRRQAELGRDSVAIAWAAQESIRTNQIVELMPGAQEYQ